jgi:hypothetical protein
MLLFLNREDTLYIMILLRVLLKYCYRLENLTTEFPLFKDAFFYVARIFILHTVHLGTHQLINY